MYYAERRAVIFSTDPGRAIYNPFTGEGDVAAAPGGQLVWYDLESETHRRLTIEEFPAGRDFHPLGLGITREHHLGCDLLAVANMASPPGIEIIHLHGDSARWVRTISHDHVTTPNAVVVLSERQVLVTNSFLFPARTHPKLNKLETLLGLPFGRVYLLTAEDRKAVETDGVHEIVPGDGVEAHVVSEGLALANGLALSEDGRVLVAAASVGQEVQIYDIDPPAVQSASNADGRRIPARVHLTSAADIKYRETLPVGFTVDNLRFVSGGHGANYTFLAAGHPSAFAYLATAAAKGEGKLSGSAVVKFTVDGKKERDTAQQARAEVNRLFTRVDKRVQSVLQDSGETIGTSSTAVSLGKDADGGDGLIVCGLWDKNVLRAKDVDLSPVKA